MDSPDLRAPQHYINRELRSEEHTSELQSQSNIVCRLLLEKKSHVVVEDPVFLSSNVAAHPFVRFGRAALVGGHSTRISSQSVSTPVPAKSQPPSPASLGNT